ncbi:hypothetical protein CTAYLR_006435 [Chrysophaeum taylorii]|uniref:Rhodanese domain-containing protein n=1 Tax=Chrysophaeum taylorii TaxID=2483200 RepID=A0AAD7UKY4_9STRA|nr:hypothetical protein CTAYLR_006435 [Chrysophaeum taylorii]
MSRSAPTKIEAVLLYYAIGQIDEPSELGEWLASFSRECLVGRVRVSREGVNATLGGPMAALEAHMLRARRERRDVFAETEFNLTRVGDEETARARRVVAWRVVEEIVTFGRAPATKATSIRRLKRDAWDAALAKPESVVIDVRNGYESAIGRFEGAATVLAPDIRSTSDFASWLESAPIPDGAPVLAYCTGGVRCERAAELIAARTNSAEVAMLDGGVVRYLEQVERDGDDGLFCGRLFVFDPRVSVRAEARRQRDCRRRERVCCLRVGPRPRLLQRPPHAPRALRNVPPPPPRLRSVLYNYRRRDWSPPPPLGVHLLRGQEKIDR